MVMASTRPGRAPARPYNYLINGAFRYMQRQAVGTLTSYTDDTYGPDRWNVLTQTAGVQIDQSTGNVAPHAGRVTQNQASSQRFGLSQIMEGYPSRGLRNRTVTFQFQAKNDVSRTIRYAILEWTGTLDTVTSDVVNDWTSATFTANNFFLAASITIAAQGSVAVGTGYTKVALTGTLSSSCNNVIVLVWTDAVVAQNGTFEMTEAMLITGARSVDWEPKNLQEELSDCQRFYQKSYVTGLPPGTSVSANGLQSVLVATAGTDYFEIVSYFRTTMRASATVVLYDWLGALGKISEIAAAAAQTDGVTPSTGVSNAGTDSFAVLHNATGNIIGIYYHYTAVAEL